MKNIDIQKKSIELQEIVSKYDVECFAGFFAYFIRYRPPSDSNDSFSLFKSKLRDFLHLIALNLSSKTRGNEDFILDESVLTNLANRLNEIKDSYSLNNFSLDRFNVDISYQQKTLIHSFTFDNYFHNGDLTYIEQDLEKFLKTFKPFEKKIIDYFGFDLQFLLDIYEYSEQLSYEKRVNNMKFSYTEEFLETLNKSDNNSHFDNAEKLSETTREQYINFVMCPHDSLKFSKSDYNKFPEEKIDKYLEIFSCNCSDNYSYLFYSDENPLDMKPIIRLPNGEYLNVFQKQLPIAYYKFFYKFLNQQEDIGERMQKHRGKVLEEKCFEIFKDFLEKENQTFFYQNYFIDKHFEQDILILSKGTAFIIETKASRFREPLRDMEKAYVKIKDDFSDTIQFGYKQCQRVKDKFNSPNNFPIYDSKGKILYIVNPKKFNNVFSIIVTLERLGPIQQDLSYLLDLCDDEIYPWSVFIYDLEVFLRALKLKRKNQKQELVEYLKFRELLNGRLFCHDELDICAFYMSNKNLFIDLAQKIETTFTMMSQNQNYFDDLYFQGIGLFKNELFLDIKRNSGYHPDERKIEAFTFDDLISAKE